MLKLTIKQTGIPLPPPSVVPDPAVQIWRDTSGAVYAYGETSGDECWMHVFGVASYHFTRDGDEVAASVAAGARTDLVLDAYRRRVLPLAVQVRGCEVLHASAVRSPAGVVGLSGDSQTGKSTIAFGLSRRGYPLWSDDAFAFELNQGRASSIGLPFEIRLRPRTASFFEVEAPPRRSMANQLTSGHNKAPIALICTLRRADDQAQPVKIRRLPFSEAFSSMLSHACWFTFADAADKRRVIGNYMELVATTPTYNVCFKSGLENLTPVLDAIEEVIQKANSSSRCQLSDDAL
jgi:hypothetical protein